MSTEVQDRLANSNALAQETLNAVRVVKAFTRELYEAERYRSEVERTFDATVTPGAGTFSLWAIDHAAWLSWLLQRLCGLGARKY